KQDASDRGRRQSVRSHQICRSQFLRRCPAPSKTRVENRVPKCDAESPAAPEHPYKTRPFSPNRVPGNACAVIFLPSLILLAERIDSNACLWTKSVKQLTSAAR